MTDLQRRAHDTARIDDALQQAAAVLRRHLEHDVPYTMKHGHGPVTAADHEVDALLRRLLPEPGDGWLSEETADDRARLQCRRVWIVDPIDGTRSFIARRPEYSISVALVEDGDPVLGGVCNPASGVTVLGGPDLGVQVRGAPALAFGAVPPGGLRVLASRSELTRGEWQRWQRADLLRVLPVGSVAYKLALVAAGAADATWTLQPKSEWDVAAGMALVRAAGGEVWSPVGEVVAFNRERPSFRGFAAAAAGHGALARRLIEQGA